MFYTVQLIVNRKNIIWFNENLQACYNNNFVKLESNVDVFMFFSGVAYVGRYLRKNPFTQHGNAD